MPQEDTLTSEAASFALAGYAFACACVALASPSVALLAAGVLLPLLTALALTLA